MIKKYEMEYAGRTLTLETGKLAEQADASVLVRCGDTVVLVCATMAEKPRAGIDFFPLSVDYEEKMYSVGRIPGGFIKREGRPSERSVLTSRLIDRPIRPLFQKGIYNDVQVVATVLSVDVDISPDVLAMIGASAALSISHIPFSEPTGAVTVGMIDGEFLLNPDVKQREQSKLHLTVAGTKDAIMMVEAGSNEISEEELVQAILFGHEEIKRVVALQEQMVNEIGKEKINLVPHKPDSELEKAVKDYAYDKMVRALDTSDRDERQNRSAQLEEETLLAMQEQFPESEKDISEVLYNIQKEIIRSKIIKQGIRPDGRSLEQVRDIWSEVGFLSRTHGSAIFTRGQTQVITIVTLGAMGDAQVIDGLSEDDMKRYIHHYNMPPYSVGETKPMRGPGRREIGHGALAERSLEPMIPTETDFPYAIRLVSEVVSSNGSTSMASVCGSTLALMDAGVPIKDPVAGVAMGLIKDTDSDAVAILTDIQGLEDFLGDMDFKVAGTEKGITAVQMDIKIKGIEESILRRALAQAKDGRLHILGKMLETIKVPRESLSPYAPKIIVFEINPEKIREVIGPGGKMINKIIAETGVKIDLEDDGRVFITTPDIDAAAKARSIIEGIAKDIEVGQVYHGKVVRIMPFGAFVELVPGKDGMVHISKLSDKRVEKVEDVINIGEQIWVKVVEIDKQGRVNLTHRGIGPDSAKKE